MLGAEVVLAQHQARRRLVQARADPHFLDALAERVLDALEQALALLQLLVVLLRSASLSSVAELEVAARGVLEALALELVELAHDPLVDALGEQQHLEPALLAAARCAGWRAPPRRSRR